MSVGMHRASWLGEVLGEEEDVTAQITAVRALDLDYSRRDGPGRRIAGVDQSSGLERAPITMTFFQAYNPSI